MDVVRCLWLCVTTPTVVRMGNASAMNHDIRHPKSWHKRIISRLTFRAALVSDCCRAPQPTQQYQRGGGAVVVVCAMAETKRHLSPEGEIYARTSPLTNEVCIGYYIEGERKKKKEEFSGGYFSHVLVDWWWSASGWIRRSCCCRRCCCCRHRLSS